MSKKEEIKEILIEYTKINLRTIVEYASDLELQFLDRYLIGSLKDIPINDYEEAPICVSMSELIILLEEVKLGMIRPFIKGELHEEIKSISDLKDYEKQKRFLATAFELEKGIDYDLGSGIVTILEEMSKYSLVFPLLSDVENIMYRRIYLFALIKHFSAVSDNSRRAFLSSNLLVQALNMGLGVSEEVEKYIRSYFIVSMRRSISLDYAACLAINNGIIGIDDYERRITVKEWVDKINKFLETTDDVGEIGIFYASDQSYKNNLVFEQKKIKKILNLYVALVSGEFIFEKGARQEIEKKVKELEKVVPAKPEDTELSFEEKLEKEKNGLMVWFMTSEGILSLTNWLDEEENKKRGVKKSVISILSKYDTNLLDENENLERIMRLQEVLHLSGYGDVEEWFLFDEKTGSFHWSE